MCRFRNKNILYKDTLFCIISRKSNASLAQLLQNKERVMFMFSLKRSIDYSSMIARLMNRVPMIFVRCVPCVLPCMLPSFSCGYMLPVNK